MRAELFLILWVTALAPLAYPVFHGSSDVPEVSSTGGSETSGQTNSGRRQSVNASASVGARRSALPEIDASAHPMFKVAAAVTVPIVAPKPIVNTSIVPALKGVVQRGGVSFAVLMPDPSTTGYVVAGVGDAVGDYRVTAVNADSITMTKTSDGTSDTLSLQGAGELP